MMKSENKQCTDRIKVSVIIPVWNVESEIERCIESLCRQTLKEIEMIFVDDCGTDASIDKVFKYSCKDSRIKIIKNEQNIGSGPSRNKGIKAAKGEYLAFCDPDDYVYFDYLEMLYQKASAGNLDIVKGSIVYIKENGSTASRDRDLNQRILKGIRENKPLYTLFTYEHHSAIYRREMILKTRSFYGSSIRSQDVTFLLRACTEAASFDLETRAKYCFCERNSSAMHNTDIKMMNGILDAYKERTNYTEKRLSTDVFVRDYVLTQTLNLIRNSYWFLKNGENDAEKENLIKEMRSYVKSLSLSSTIKEKSFSVRALLEYSVILPSSPFVMSWENENAQGWIDIAGLWTDFVLNHPECLSKIRRDIVILISQTRAMCQAEYADTKEKRNVQILKDIIKPLPISIKRLYWIYGIFHGLNQESLMYRILKSIYRKRI